MWGLISTKSTQYYLVKGIYNILYFFIEVCPVCVIPMRNLKSWRTPLSIVVIALNFPGMYSPYFWVKSKSGILATSLIYALYYYCSIYFGKLKCCGWYISLILCKLSLKTSWEQSSQVLNSQVLYSAVYTPNVWQKPQAKLLIGSYSQVSAKCL